MKTIAISVRDKIAVNMSNVPYTCGNSDFVINFDFDAEWDEFSVKTARFIKDDRTYQDQVFQGNECPVPVIYNTNNIRVGVFAGNLHTSTPAIITANKGILCVGGSPEAPSDDVYAQIMELLQDLHFVSVTGMTAAQVNALDGMFKAAVYDDSKNVSVAYTAFKAAFGLTGGGTPDTPDEPDDPDVPGVITYTITAELVNMTSSNAAKTVTENASYSATLTAADGYKLDSVSVLMGGVDITATAYNGATIHIPAVTGNVEIVASAVLVESGKDAELITDGLIAFFDFRNLASGSGNGSTGYYIPATQGTGGIYSWYAYDAGNEYGAFANGTFCSGNAFTEHRFGTDFTWIQKAYCDVSSTLLAIGKYFEPTNMGTKVNVTYNTAESTAVKLVTTLEKVDAGYQTVAVTVSAKILSIYLDGELVATVDGAGIDGFVSWYDVYASSIKNWWSSNETVKKITANAFYDRALSEVEVVEMNEYLKTLEVSK